MNETIQLANGTLIENSHCLETGGTLFVYITGSDDMARYFNLFVDPDNTAVIHANRYGDETDYEGYTDLYSINKEYGNINLALKKVLTN